MRGGAAVAIVVALAGAVPATGAAAVESGGTLDPQHPRVEVRLRVEDPGAPGRPGTAGGEWSPLRYVAVPASTASTGAPGLEHLCNATGGAVTPDAVPWGWRYTVVVTDARDGTVVSSSVECVPLDPADPSAPPGAPALPSPPTVAEVWRAVGLPGPGLGVDPAGEGVTGLDTRVWSGGPTNAAVAVSLRGFRVTGTARLVEYVVDPGEGPVVRTPTPGDADHPAAHVVFETKGRRRLAVTARWQATVTLSGPGVTARPVDLGTALVTSARDYRVVEVRSVLLP